MNNHLKPENVKALEDKLKDGTTHMMDLLMVFKCSDEAKIACHFSGTHYENGAAKLVSTVQFIDGKTYRLEISESVE